MAWTAALDPTVEQVKDTLQKFLDNDNYVFDALGSYRTRVINGCFQVWQRGTAKGSLGPGAGFNTADRFRCSMSGTTAVISENQSTSHPLGTGGQAYSWGITVNTADAAVAAADLAYLRTAIEGYNFGDILTGQVGGGFFTVAFWVRSPKTGIHCFGVTNSAGDRSYVAEYTVNAANVWERKTITIPTNFTAGGTWNYTSGIGLQLRWAVMAGTSWQTATPGQWVTSNPVGTANQQNLLDTVGNFFGIADVLLVPGQVAPSILERRPFGLELALCQRYYCKTFSYGVAAVQAADLSCFRWPCVGGASGSGYSPRWMFPVTMRATPTVTLFNPAAANAQARNLSTSVDCSSTAINAPTDSGVNITCTADAGAAIGHVLGVHATAEAEI